MRRILALEPANRRARVQAGVLNADLSAAAAPHGLHYAPDPSSQSACTLGGNVAENSGGPHCLKYGVTSRYVTGLTVVGVDGRVVELGGTGSSPWPDLTGLFVGSEGCFGIATEIELRLVPRATSVRTLLAAFPRLEQAGAAVSAIIAGGLLPAALEILDRATITAVEESIFAAGYPRDAGAVLVAEFDGPDEALDADAERAERLCREHGASDVRRAKEAAERAQLWKGRKKAFGAMGRLAPDMVVQDATVPRSRLPAVLAAISDIARRHELHVANVFHAGDGNLHPNILFDRRDPDQVSRVEAASREIMSACVAAGGTITGEHGVGLDKRNYMSLVHGRDELRAMAGVRDVFDPRGLWNPGKVLPDLEPGVVFESGGRGSGQNAPPERIRPVDEGVLAEWMSRATAERWRVAPDGSTARRGVDLRVDTSALDAVIEYEPADLTITVGAGMTIARLTDVTSAAGQWLPVDAPDLDPGHVGGIVSRGVEGALCDSHGGLRDLVLGLTLVTGDGRILRLGGRVVKNVAGFDLLKAVVGSRGALGIVTSVTMRLHPLPESDVTWTVEAARPAELAVLATRLAALPLAPASVEVGWGDDGAVLAVRALGSAAAVVAFRQAAGVLLADTTAARGAEATAARARLRRPLSESGARVRLAAPAGRIDDLVREARLRADESGAQPRGWILADRGVAWVGLPRGAAPDGFAGHLSPGAAAWAEAIKRVFDPAGVLPDGPFNPGHGPR
jgi:D-lactate dehydrogenase (cytochrome)